MKIENEDVTFVIPTNKENGAIPTLSCIPKESKVIVERKGKDYEARNRGVKKAKTDLIIICDDDIKFDLQFLETAFSRLSKNTLIGLEDYYPMKWCITRFMCFWKEDWKRVGGFDESRKKYGGPDTDFCIRMQKIGVKNLRLPRTSIEHLNPEKKRKAKEEIGVLFYLWRRHPKQITIPAIKLLVRKITGKEI